MNAQLFEIVRKGAAIVIVLFCGFQISRMWKAFLERVPVENPLFPQNLETGIRNYIIFFTVIYLSVAAANIWSFYTKKKLYAIILISVLVLVGVQVFYPTIINFFLNHQL